MVNVEAYHHLQAALSPSNTALIAVSKFKSVTDILTLYAAGHRAFGENYVQELVDKYEQLPKDIEWHFIGHLQTNKVKYIAPFVSLIQSVDSLKLLNEIQKQAVKCNRIIDVLLQVYVGDEETKYGMDATTCLELLSVWEAQSTAFSHVRIIGMMGMASLIEDPTQVKSEFIAMKQLFEVLRKQFFFGNDAFKVLSMGMSGDYPLAIEAGSNMVRIGSTIFGHR